MSNFYILQVESCSFQFTGIYIASIRLKTFSTCLTEIQNLSALNKQQWQYGAMVDG